MVQVQEILSHHIIDHSLNEKLFGLLPLSSNLITLFGITLVLAVLLPALAKYRKPRLLMAAVEGMVVFIRENIVIANFGSEGRKYTPYFCSLFIFLLIANSL